MDTSVLVAPADVELGEKLTLALRADARTDLRAAMWWHEEAAQHMRFLVATPLYESVGPRKTYLHLNELIDSAGLALPPGALWAVETDHQIVTNFRGITTPGFHSMTFVNCQFNDLHVDFAHLYFLAKTRAGVRKKRT